MGQGASQLFDNLTYNPDVQRQKAADKKEGAKIRDKYREILTNVQKYIKKEMIKIEMIKIRLSLKTQMKHPHLFHESFK